MRMKSSENNEPERARLAYRINSAQNKADIERGMARRRRALANWERVMQAMARYGKSVRSRREQGMEGEGEGGQYFP